MFNKNGLVARSLIFFILIISFSIVFLTSRTPHPFLPLIVTIGLTIFVISFINTEFALTILIFSMLLSPELNLGGVGGRAVTLRIDDILLMVVFLGWLAKMSINKDVGLIRVTPLNSSIYVYMLIYVIATLLGLLCRSITLKGAFFYLFKYFEYFLLYFMVVNCLKDRRQIIRLIHAIILVALITGLYAWYMHFSGIERASAPFQTKTGGEPATLGGYLLLIMMIVLGILLNSSSFKEKILMSAALCIMFPAFLFTLSRGSWISFIPAYLTLMFLSRKGKQMLLIVSIIIASTFSVIFPKYVYNRIAYTFQKQTERHMLGKKIGIDESTAARIDTLNASLKHWIRSPIIGHGASSAGVVVDNTYMRILIEAGLLGLIAFLRLLFTLFRNSLRITGFLREDNFSHGISCGFVAGLMGLLTHSFGAATFILIRIMEPFWFLAAIVIALPEIITDARGA